MYQSDLIHYVETAILIEYTAQSRLHGHWRYRDCWRPECFLQKIISFPCYQILLLETFKNSNDFMKIMQHINENSADRIFILLNQGLDWLEPMRNNDHQCSSSIPKCVKTNRWISVLFIIVLIMCFNDFTSVAVYLRLTALSIFTTFFVFVFTASLI